MPPATRGPRRQCAASIEHRAQSSRVPSRTGENRSPAGARKSGDLPATLEAHFRKCRSMPARKCRHCRMLKRVYELSGFSFLHKQDIRFCWLSWRQRRRGNVVRRLGGKRNGGRQRKRRHRGRWSRRIASVCRHLQGAHAGLRCRVEHLRAVPQGHGLQRQLEADLRCLVEQLRSVPRDGLQERREAGVRYRGEYLRWLPRQ